MGMCHLVVGEFQLPCNECSSLLNRVWNHSDHEKGLLTQPQSLHVNEREALLYGC